MLEALPGWFDLKAVRNGQAILADGNLYFNRSGTTIVETVEILAEIFHGYPAGRQGKAWVRLSRLPLGGLALQYRQAGPQSAVDVDRENVKVGQDVTAPVRVYPQGDPQPGEGALGELEARDPPFQVRARVAGAGAIVFGFCH